MTILTIPSNPSPVSASTGPARTCVGCGVVAEKEELVRATALVRDDGVAELAFDVSGKGRGIHVHPVLGCLERASRGGFSKATKGRVHVDVQGWALQIADSLERRALSLLASARSKRAVQAGHDASFLAMSQTDTILVVATDAGSVATRREVTGWASEGRVCALATREQLGRVLGRNDIAVLAVMNHSMGHEILRASRHGSALRSAAAASAKKVEAL